MWSHVAECYRLRADREQIAVNRSPLTATVSRSIGTLVPRRLIVHAGINHLSVEGINRQVMDGA
jgi:hypothetical protein